MTIIQSIIIAIIEGVTEFLPVSSTGHMILASSIMKIGEDSFVKTFEISIQTGAIFAIVMLYSRQIFKNLSICFKLGIAFIPTAFIGFLAYDIIKAYLFNPIIVSVSLILGGIVLILVDKKVAGRKSQTDMIENLSYKNAFFIGLIQCFSMIPGVSRAAATIIGGVFNGLDKKQATEFSFLLAVPTMIAASGYDLLKTPVTFSNHEILLLALGFLTAFLTAWLIVKLFLKLVENYGFKHFGYYRIIIGVIFLLFVR